MQHNHLGISMRRIFWIGSGFFQNSLKKCGLEVYFFNFEDVAVFNWADLVAMAGFKPDVVVVADKSRLPFVLGMEKFPCLTVFYAVDTHVHSWYSFYAQAFDICLVSLYDHQEFFRHKNIPDERIIWSPPFAKDDDVPSAHAKAQWDCLFVGNVNNENLPKRVEFFKELAEYIPSLHVASGRYVELFPKGRVLINQCENEDLNFRVFEALGCGGCLVTPDVGHGLSTLFEPNEDLMLYEQHNAKDAARCIKLLLDDPALRAKLAENGLAKVNKQHRAIHRASAFASFLNNIKNADEIIAKRLDAADAIRSKWLKPIYLLLADSLQNDMLRQAYLKSALSSEID